MGGGALEVGAMCPPPPPAGSALFLSDVNTGHAGVSLTWEAPGEASCPVCVWTSPRPSWGVGPEDRTGHQACGSAGLWLNSNQEPPREGQGLAADRGPQALWCGPRPGNRCS